MIPSTLLSGKNVLVGVSGSISAYKTIELVRLLTKAGASVRVVMTQSAKRFVTPLTFETLTGHAVLDETSENWHSDHNHIGIAAWAHAFIIAPATANTINKLANGIADNLLTQTALAYAKEKLLAPAANTVMMANPITQGALKMLKLANFTVIETQTKELACKTQGDGALAEPIELFYQTARSLLKEDFWSYRRVVVTGGGTIEPIDDVRFISNFSSGKMASALALALYFKGSDVCFISTKFPVALPATMCTLEVQTAREMQGYLADSLRVAKKGVQTAPSLMHEALPQQIIKRPFLFMAAAVSDYAPAAAQQGKLKKETLGETWQLLLQQNPDIVSSLDRSEITTIGFKAEMDPQNARANAQNMLKNKKLDGVCLNLLSDQKSFGSDDNAIEYFYDDTSVMLEQSDKLGLSLKLLKHLSQTSN